MNKKFYLLVMIIISGGSKLLCLDIRPTYRLFRARTFTLHFNTRQFQDVTQEYIDQLIVNLPNISATTIPIKAIKGMYLSYKNNPSQEDIFYAKKYLKSAIDDNPFIKIPEAELSKNLLYRTKK